MKAVESQAASPANEAEPEHGKGLYYLAMVHHAAGRTKAVRELLGRFDRSDETPCHEKARSLLEGQGGMSNWCASRSWRAHTLALNDGNDGIR